MAAQFKCFVVLALGLCFALAIFTLPAAQVAHAASFTVNTTADTDDSVKGDGICADSTGACSLRAAISEANTLAGADTITIPTGVYTLSIPGTGEQFNVSGDLDIRNGNLSLIGAGANNTIIQAGTTGGSAGNGIDRVLEVIGAFAVNISGVTIRYGQSGAGAGGGGMSISSGGTVTLNECIVADNYSLSTFGGGGVLLAAGSLTINNSTIANNTNTVTGGGVRNLNGGSGGVAFVSNSTFSRNSSGQGGAIATNGPLTVSNSTFYGNTATTAGGIYNNASTVVLQNSIVTASTGGACSGFAGTSTNNLVDDGTCGIAVNAVTNFDASLANNGGPTPTHALLTGSNGIDAGANNCPDNTATPLARDQRNYGRPAGTTCDIGAFEANSTPLAVLLAAFDAVSQTDHVLVTWETTTELNNQGFHLYRGQTPNAPEAMLAFVPAQSPGSTQGAAYQWMDNNVTTGATYYYWLEDIDLSGSTTLHGPVSVSHVGPTAVALAGFTAVENQSAMPPGAPLAAVSAAALGLAAAWLGRRSRQDSR
jgi:CSLREA domain-containing protein